MVLWIWRAHTGTSAGRYGESPIKAKELFIKTLFAERSGVPPGKGTPSAYRHMPIRLTPARIGAYAIRREYTPRIFKKALTKSLRYGILTGYQRDRGVAQIGRALGSGPRGRKFKSCHSDQKSRGSACPVRSFFRCSAVCASHFASHCASQRAPPTPELPCAPSGYSPRSRRKSRTSRTAGRRRGCRRRRAASCRAGG